MNSNNVESAANFEMYKELLADIDRFSLKSSAGLQPLALKRALVVLFAGVGFKSLLEGVYPEDEKDIAPVIGSVLDYMDSGEEVENLAAIVAETCKGIRSLVECNVEKVCELNQIFNMVLSITAEDLFLGS